MCTRGCCALERICRLYWCSAAHNNTHNVVTWGSVTERLIYKNKHRFYMYVSLWKQHGKSDKWETPGSLVNMLLKQKGWTLHVEISAEDSGGLQDLSRGELCYCKIVHHINRKFMYYNMSSNPNNKISCLFPNEHVQNGYCDFACRAGHDSRCCGCSSWGRAGHPLTGRLVVQPLVASICMSKYLWVKYWRAYDEC